MGLYAQMLVRYMRMPIEALCKSLIAANIQVDLAATPVFIDKDPTDPHCGSYRRC
jgi:hypothetical protein